MSKYYHSQNISCEIARYGKSFIFIFQDFFTSINKTSIFAGRLGTMSLCYEVLRLLSRLATRKATLIYHVYK